MKCYKPTYYDQFRCLASDCADTCCHLWDIDIDPDALAYYESLTGPLGEKIRNSMEQAEDGPIMALKDGRCPMLRQDGLCELQAQLGHDALCQTCREFPRLRHDYGNFLELGMELSCPEAARLILTEPYSITVTEIPGGEEPLYDRELMDILFRTRDEALSFVSTCTLPIPQMMAVLLLYGASVQNEIDGGEPAELHPNEDLLEALNDVDTPNFPSVVKFFRGLDILTPQWESLLTDADTCLPWLPCHRALLRYFIERYWLQAVSDYDLTSRLKFMLFSTLLVKSLPGDPVDNAHLYSKEIENDCDNVDAILDGCYTSPAFTDQNLLSLLLR